MITIIVFYYLFHQTFKSTCCRLANKQYLVYFRHGGHMSVAMYGLSRSGEILSGSIQPFLCSGGK
jgi:hypothetical protein